eukprot:COSAG01_NODE_370_length_18018_cov_142.063620_24_plen_56_part_00
MVQQLWAQRSDVRGASHYKRAKGGKRCLFLSFLSSSWYRWWRCSGCGRADERACA